MPPIKPYYRRIIDDIRQLIALGELKPGDKLPSTRELAERYGVQRSTVRTAITLLIEAGVLVGHQGVGVFVAEQPQSPTTG